MKKWGISIIIIGFLLACGNNAPPDRQETVVPDGKRLFKTYCVVCHGANGKMAMNGAKDLSISTRSLEERIQIITEGKNTMTSFKAVLNPRQIEAVANYTFELRQ